MLRSLELYDLALFVKDTIAKNEFRKCNYYLQGTFQVCSVSHISFRFLAFSSNVVTLCTTWSNT